MNDLELQAWADAVPPCSLLGQAVWRLRTPFRPDERVCREKRVLVRKKRRRVLPLLRMPILRIVARSDKPLFSREIVAALRRDVALMAEVGIGEWTPDDELPSQIRRMKREGFLQSVRAPRSLSSPPGSTTAVVYSLTDAGRAALKEGRKR